MNLEHERGQLAREAHNAGYVVHRLVHFAQFMGESPPPGWSLGDVDDLAARLQDWAVAVSSELTDRALADELTVRTQEQRRWRAIRAELDWADQKHGPASPPSRSC